jgi:hypothetical protein
VLVGVEIAAYLSVFAHLGAAGSAHGPPRQRRPWPFGHGGTGRGFDVHGEEAAWLLHHRMYSVRAQPALTTETRGQTNAMVFGSPPGVFRRQKAVLLPSVFNDEATAHVGPCGGRCLP